MKKIELLSPAGSPEHLRAVISRGADAVYLGMDRFSARDYAANFRQKDLKEAVNICKSNGARIYLAMNTLVKNEELERFFGQLAFAYARGIDAVIIQETSFIDLIKKNFPGLRVHISTQAAVMNCAHAKILRRADRITLPRELRQEEIRQLKENSGQEIEIFAHGALCVSTSGQCLFSSLLGGRSGNRGKCAQPCSKKYNGEYYLSTKELCLIGRLPEIIRMGVDAVKIEGRMRAPYYAATVTEIYRKAIDSFYAGKFEVTAAMRTKLEQAFSREFTEGGFGGADIFNRAKAAGRSSHDKLGECRVEVKNIKINRKNVSPKLPVIKGEIGAKLLLVRVYHPEDARTAAANGADIVYLDLFCKEFEAAKRSLGCKLFAVTPALMLDTDMGRIKAAIKKNQPDGILAGNAGMLNLGLSIPIHLNYNLNCFNDIDIASLPPGCLPIISPELSLKELKRFKQKNFVALVHGKLRLMTLRHELEDGPIKDERGGLFYVRKVHHGSEILNEKEIGLLGKSSLLPAAGINRFFVDTDTNVGPIVALYRNILDGGKADDAKLKRDYVLGWSFKGVQ